MPFWSAVGSGVSVTDAFKETMDNNLAVLESQLDARIEALRRAAKLDYAGATVLQSKETKIKDNAGTYFMYGGNDFQYNSGQIWCYQTGLDIPTGSDVVEIGSNPLKHNHKNTKAEAMTTSFSANRGGGRSLGKFTIGNKDMVSQDSTYELVNGTNFGVISSPSSVSGDLTFPLYGQNVINFRDRTRTHNNIPPCANIHVRNKKWVAMAALMSRAAPADLIDQDAWNAAEMQYLSLRVPDLDEFKDEDLTSHDYLLRMTLDGVEDGDVQIMKQSVQMLLDIFAGDAFKKLSRVLGNDTDDDGAVTTKDEGSVAVTLEQILKPKLDVELVPKGEFMYWYTQKLETLDRIFQKIELIKDMLKSIKPMNYTGRIIISTTDDVEKKVIEHYGGKRWRRIENFLRGVDGSEAKWEEEREFGRKLGEEYVCLRESNIPLHTHGSTLNGTPSTGDVEWLEKERGGQTTKMVNFSIAEGTSKAKSVQNVPTNYQLSPLEYAAKTKLTIPHDNMPPFKEVYIWECVEATEYEKFISDEPTPGYCKVIWDPNGGTLSSGSKHFQYVQKGTQLTSAKTATKQGHTFTGWYDENGTMWFDHNRNRVAGVDTTVNRHIVLTAQWSVNEIIITFDANGGYFPGRTETSYTRTYKYGQKLGGLPMVGHVVDDWGDETTFEAWYSDRVIGDVITSETIATENTTYYAHYNRILYYKNKGGVIQDDEVWSGFSGSAWLQTIKSLNFNYDFDLVMNATTSDNVDANQDLIGIHSSIEFGTYKGKFMWEVFTPGNANTFGSHACEANKNYYWRLVNTRNPSESTNHLDCYISEDGINWILDRDGDVNLGNNQGPIIIGNDEDWKGEPWLGTVDMKKSYVNVFGYRYSFKLDNKAEVTFNSNGGDPVPGKRVDIGNMLGDTPTATWTGHKFLGWYTAASGGELVTSTRVILGDVTFYAHWNVSTYTIVFDRQGGTGGTDRLSVTYGQTLPSITMPTRQGYTFGGYYLGKNGASTQYFTSTGAPTRTWDRTENTTLYAKWSGKQYELWVNPNGGTYRGSASATKISPDSSNRKLTTGSDWFQGIGAGADGATRSGFSLLGYYDLAAGGNQVYDSNGRAVKGTYWDGNYSTTAPTPKFKGLPGAATSLTVYAAWQGALCTITFVPNNGGANTVI